ncbi:MAG: fibronectin type III domain-containing protein, partial [Spirochaetota bacterium]
MTARSAHTARFLVLLILLAGPAMICAQSAPPAYILPAGETAIVVLGDAPAETRGFRVYRKDVGDRHYRLMTPDPIEAVKNPYEAARLIGEDFEWISRKMDSIDPTVVWRRLSRNAGRAQAYALLSHGLRVALGRTWIDAEVTRGRRYDYRVVILDATGAEMERYQRRITIRDPERPEAPGSVSASYADAVVRIEWSYPPFAGGTEDRTVGFTVFRREGDSPFEPLFSAPVLRIEDHLLAFDERVRVGESYTYGVAAVDIIGTVSRRVDAAAITIEDTRAPLVPVGLKAIDREEDVVVIWKLSPELDVDHYDVYRSRSVEEKAELVKLNDEPIPYDEPRFVDTDAPRGIPLYYRVSAVDKHGNESPLSGPAPVLAEDKEPPAAVSELRARVEEESRVVTLSWTAPEDRDLSGFYVYSGPDEESLMRLTGAPLAVAEDEEPGYTDEGYKERGLQPGRSLVYAVSAVDNSYNESPRVTVSVTVPDNVAPRPPESLAARPLRDGGVRLIWQPLLSFDLGGYRLYRNTAGEAMSDGAQAMIAELEPGANSWTDTGVERGTRYHYHLTAIDESGNESDPSTRVEVVPTDIVAPAPPASVRAELQRRGVQLQWEKSPDADVQAYRVYRSHVSGGKPQRLLATVEQELTYRDRQGSGGFVYGVSAVDSSGNEG